MGKNTVEWKVSQAEFKGYMKSKIESIDEKLDTICRNDLNQDLRINKVENRLVATEIKGSLFGAIGGIAGGFLAGVLRLFR
jgi:hypothetical protein